MARDSSIAFSPSRYQIDLVREYHTQLVADVVTGKLTVRDVALLELALLVETDSHSVRAKDVQVNSFAVRI